MTNRSDKPCIDCVAEGVTTKRKIATTKAGKPVPGPRCATHHRAKRNTTRDTAWERRLAAIYGITAAEYWAIHEYQLGRCYLCQRATGVAKRLSVDHCHESGVVRGLLCLPCNRNVLGHARDEIAFFERAIDYLNSPPAVRAIGLKIVPEEG